jgi:hypothetical protein
MAQTLHRVFLWRGIWRTNANRVLGACNRCFELQAKLPSGASPYVTIPSEVSAALTTLQNWAVATLNQKGSILANNP